MGLNRHRFGDDMKKSFSLLIKPASCSCNLRCSYCFYLDKTAVFGPGPLRMDEATLSTMIRKFMELRMPVATFGWQGGEPTLTGVDFFRRAVELQRRFAVKGQVVTNALQTNGTLLDDVWGEFLHRNRFLVGISVDGPAEIHDLNRLHADGRGSHAEVMRGIDLMKKHRVEFNVLTLVSSANQDRPVEIYRYLKSLGVNYHQYIECVEFDRDAKLKPCSVDPLKWGKFLCAVFDEWYPADTRTVSVRLFDTVLAKLVDRAENSCSAGTDCRQYFVVEYNGDIFPCDFYVRPELKLGNIRTDEFETLLDSPLYRDFGGRKRAWNDRCRNCEFLNLCAGCCPKNRPETDPSNLSALCEGWRLFYSHTIERFDLLAAQIAAERKAAVSRHLAGAAPPGRNAPCPCGSGRKFKKCCGA